MDNLSGIEVICLSDEEDESSRMAQNSASRHIGNEVIIVADGEETVEDNSFTLSLEPLLNDCIMSLRGMTQKPQQSNEIRAKGKAKKSEHSELKCQGWAKGTGFGGATENKAAPPKLTAAELAAIAFESKADASLMAKCTELTAVVRRVLAYVEAHPEKRSRACAKLLDILVDGEDGVLLHRMGLLFRSDALLRSEYGVFHSALDLIEVRLR